MRLIFLLALLVFSITSYAQSSDMQSYSYYAEIAIKGAGISTVLYVQPVVITNLETGQSEKYVKVSNRSLSDLYEDQKTELTTIDQAQRIVDFIDQLREPLRSSPTKNPYVVYTLSPTETLHCRMEGNGLGNKWLMAIITGFGTDDSLKTNIGLSSLGPFQQGLINVIKKLESL